MPMTQEIKFKTIRVSEKGQIAIPVEIQREMGIEKGEELLLIKKGNRIILEKPKKFSLGLQGEFADLELISESSLKKLWNNKNDEIWNQYLKAKKK
ncbi:MAG TPA: AbrB/MazE/SpoVT family DNA-binding domain-containing protein [Nitrososphaerales archaeon]|nr:AbrB/MazE/SpoVT family DNA-binding domain-containing protein [Nitrososphaerales archaeon]